MTFLIFYGIIIIENKKGGIIIKLDRRTIHISHHARLRLSDRVNLSNPQHLKQYVQKARYEGVDLANATKEQKYWAHISLRNLTGRIVKFYDGYCFIFNSKSNAKTTLITVIPVFKGNTKEILNNHREYIKESKINKVI